jgi:hypothetical protein
MEVYPSTEFGAERKMTPTHLCKRKTRMVKAVFKDCT